MIETAFIALGSNLHDPLMQVERALRQLAERPGVRVLRVSSWYGNPAVTDEPQPDYVNGVAELETALPPLSLLAVLQAIETAQGRRRESPNAARTLDLDLLLYGNQTLRRPQLQLPHPRLGERDFVLYPLLEIAPELCLPDGSPLSLLCEKISRRSGLQVLEKSLAV